MSGSGDEDLHHEIIAGIYDAAGGTEAWSAPLGAIARLIGAQTLVTGIQHPDHEEILHAVVPESFIEPYRTEWYKHDVWLHGALRHPFGTTVTSPDCLPDEEFLSSQVYNEFVRDHDLRYLLGGALKIGGSIAHFGYHRPPLGVDFGQDEVKAFGRLLPHLQRALDMRARFSDLGGMQAISLAALDTLPIAIIVIDEGLRVHIANRRAERMLARGDGLSGGSFGRPLSAARTEETAKLRALAVEVCRRPPGAGGAAQVSRAGGG